MTDKWVLDEERLKAWRREAAKQIANVRARERRERNNPWSKPAVTKPRMLQEEMTKQGSPRDAPSE